MSFDTSYLVKPSHICLNPFGTGQCLSTNIKFTKNLHLKSLNPFGTGQCLSTVMEMAQKADPECLNPFGTGQCLSTSKTYQLRN